MTLTDFEDLLLREQFSAGSMGPKALAGVREEAGTIVVPDDTAQLTLTG
jgi:carbamate kinase